MTEVSPELHARALQIARYGHSQNGHTDPEGSDALRQIVEDYPHGRAKLIARIQELEAEVESLRLKAVDPRWDAAVEWLINWSIGACPGIDDAFRALSVGACTEDEANAGQMADGRSLEQARRDWETDKCPRCGGLEGTHVVRDCGPSRG